MQKNETTALACHKALVRIAGIDAGYLEMIATDEYRFYYVKDYVEKQSPQAISLTMPVRKEPYLSETLLPFFDNLLFEGDQLRVVEKYFGLNRYSIVDRFKLLMVTGQSLLSPVSVHPLVDNKPIEFKMDFSESPHEMKILNVTSAYKDLCAVCMLESSEQGHSSCLNRLWGRNRKLSIEVFAEEPANIFRAVISGQSFSGAQRKALFHLSKQGVLTRTNPAPSHILKPDGDFPQMPANEHLTMTIAEHLGFQAPPNALIRVEGIGLIYVVRRFDTEHKGESFTYEDMAQISEEMADHKDQATLEMIAMNIKRFASSPKIELAEFFHRIVFCFLTGNGDMHLKNWSLGYSTHSHLVKLAPIYDFLNVRCSYPQEQVEMILSLCGKQRDLIRKDFEVFAEQTLQLPDSFVQKIFTDLPRWRDVIHEYCERSLLTEDMQHRYIHIVEERFQRMMER
jgi:serine/threonine-protein kinase HipA